MGQVTDGTTASVQFHIAAISQPCATIAMNKRKMEAPTFGESFHPIGT
jgi:hypothetical protein